MQVSSPLKLFGLGSAAGVATLACLYPLIGLAALVVAAAVIVAVVYVLTALRWKVLMSYYEKLDLNIAAIGYLATHMPEFMQLDYEEQKRLVVETMEMLAEKLSTGKMSMEEYEKYLEKGRELLGLVTERREVYAQAQ